MPPRSVRLAFVSALALGLLAAAGCGPAKLDVSKTYTMDAGSVESIILDPQPKPQKVTVDFNSKTADVYVYLIKSDGSEKELDTTPNKDVTLGSKQGKEGNFTADVPENTRTRVLLRGATQKTEVTVKVTNK